jgi:hypothetical protein
MGQLRRVHEGGGIMAREFKEIAHLKTNLDKFKENYDSIDWGDLKEKPVDKEKAQKCKRHETAGMCGEYGFNTFDEEKFKENFEQIDWTKKPE